MAGRNYTGMLLTQLGRLLITMVIRIKHSLIIGMIQNSQDITRLSFKKCGINTRAFTYKLQALIKGGWCKATLQQLDSNLLFFQGMHTSWLTRGYQPNQLDVEKTIEESETTTSVVTCFLQKVFLSWLSWLRQIVKEWQSSVSVIYEPKTQNLIMFV